MKFTEVTLDEIMAWQPCQPYTRERVAELFNGRQALSMRDIATLDIPTEHRIWAMLHFFTDRELHGLACDFAERMVHLSGDGRSQVAIDTKRAWLRGETTDGELAAASNAAFDAVWNAALGTKPAAFLATLAAARAAAPTATKTMPKEVIWATTLDAAYHTAHVAAEAIGDAERQWQTKQMLVFV
jgi:hypothetical protein